MADAGTAMRTELSIMINNHYERHYGSLGWLPDIGDLLVSSRRCRPHVAVLVATILVMFARAACWTLLYCVTYAQVIWAQVAIAILIFLGTAVHPLVAF